MTEYSLCQDFLSSLLRAAGWVPASVGIMWSPSQPDKDPSYPGCRGCERVGGTVGALGRSMGPYGAVVSGKRNYKQIAEGQHIISRLVASLWLANVPNYMAVKDLINCGVHGGHSKDGGS